MALLLTIPTFDDPVARDIRRKSTGELYVVRTVWNRALDFATSRLTRDLRFMFGRPPLTMPLTLEMPGPSLRSARIDVDPNALEALIETVGSANVACCPQRGDPPLDSTVFELTFGEELDETRYRWTASAPAGWEPLSQFAMRLIRLVDEPAGAPVR